MSNKIPCIIEIPFEKGIATFQGLFERPSINTEIIEIPYMSVSTYTQGRTKWNNVELGFYEHYNSEEFKFLNEWFNEMCDSITGRKGHAIGYRKNIIIKQIDPSGFVCGKWILTGAFIVSYRTDIDYNNVCKKIISNKLTRKVLFEKTNHPTMQISITVELSIDRAVFE